MNYLENNGSSGGPTQVMHPLLVNTVVFRGAESHRKILQDLRPEALEMYRLKRTGKVVRFFPHRAKFHHIRETH